MELVKYPPQLYHYPWQLIKPYERKDALQGLQQLEKQRASNSTAGETDSGIALENSAVWDTKRMALRPFGKMLVREQERAYGVLQVKYHISRDLQNTSANPDEDTV